MGERELRIAIPGKESSTENYRKVLQFLGAEPVLVDMECDASEFDGLLLPGGGDVEPARFGQENCGSTDIDEELDVLQFTVLDRFIKQKKPVLGICRGHQVLNIYFGGNLIQDLGEERNLRHRYAKEGKDKVHRTQTAADSWLGGLYGTEYMTNSAHHQAVGITGRGLRAVSYAEDGVIEALEHETLPVFSVQWHPERLCFGKKEEAAVDGSLVMRYFLKQCAS